MKIVFLCAVALGCGHSDAPEHKTGPLYPAPTGCMFKDTSFSLDQARIEPIVGGHVVLAPDQSDDTTCAFSDPQTKVVRVIVSYHAGGNFDSISADAFSMSNPPVPVQIGDEARYADFKNGKGGNLVVRSGNAVFVIGGSEHQAQYEQVAKLLVP
ncbi:MAG: hypothetical protein QM831_25430 [Kofleriaceae bacterium]